MLKFRSCISCSDYQYYGQMPGNTMATKKLDSLYYLNKEKNTNTLNKIAQVNLLRNRLAGAKTIIQETKGNT